MADNNLFKSMDMIINDTGVLVYVIDLESYELVYVNEKCKEEFGKEILGKTCFEVLQKGENTPCKFCSITDISTKTLKIGDTFEWDNVNSINGRHYVFNDRIALWENDRKVKIQVGIDVTEQQQLQKELLEEKNNAVASFETLLDATIEGIFIFDHEKRCKLVNQVVSRLFGYSKDEMIGMRALEFIAEDSIETVIEYMKNSVQEPYEANMKRKDGSQFPALLRGYNVKLAGEDVRVSAIIDITKQKKYEKEILKLAHYDILTTLPNRVLLKEYISQAINRSIRTKQHYALLFIDLDNFKMVNDTVGHNVGDKVLVETAKRLKKSVRKNDVVARLGGDEFVILIETNCIDKESVIDNIIVVAEKILHHLQQPYYIEENVFRITASIGIKLFNDATFSMDELMKYADSAMYNAKSSGKNRFAFFNPQLQEIMETKILLIDNLREAIEKGNMELHYQTQTSYRKNKKIVGVEALVRWVDPVKGVISPAEFIPLAEESGLIIRLGEWIMEEAVKQVHSWRNDSEKRNWRVSINVSSKQFEEENFIARLEEILQKYDVKSGLIMLELTEGILIQNFKETIEKLHKLKALGISLSIDDFGTGYSSLSYLKQLPMDELKIDKSFIDDLTTDENDEIITQTIISIGQKFGLDVIAEGVETQEQFEKLHSFGCYLFQGYFFARPTKAELL
jgi:diguanylate cyclase (GGDEF)-like protein/PAS domain S-box-containing protein